MTTTNLDALKPLADELVQFVNSPAFLSGETRDDSQTFDLGKCTVSWQVVDSTVFAKCIHSPDEKSPTECFEEQILSEIAGVFTSINGYCNCDPEVLEISWPAGDLIEKQIINSSRTRALAQEIADDPTGKVDLETAIDAIFQCISNHLGAIMDTRLLTRSKRFAPLEVLFHAYCAGLFPFGWDPETNTILCVRPSSSA
ncbi:hypothetical protein [Gimesia sp.]|uniref:hypothetical protein n=1 Tax=Gimesia sp. TaxID=2024833 RepID=UPI003A92B3A2